MRRDPKVQPHVMKPNLHLVTVGVPPQHGAHDPRCTLLALAFLPLACTNDAANQVLAPVALGVTTSAAPYYSDGNLTLFEAQTPVPLPVRRPTDGELKSLGAAPAGTPYPRAPFLSYDDEQIEVQYVISNVDDTPHNVWMLIDPWNEFVRYRPGVTVVDDDTTVPNLGYDLGFAVPAKSRIEGTVTSDDFREIAIKLASTENVISSSSATATPASADNSLSVTALANHIFDQQNRSNSGDPLFTPWIPPSIAGLTGFDLGLRTSEAANVAVELIISVEDLNGNRFVVQDSASAEIGVPPTILSPPGARF